MSGYVMGSAENVVTMPVCIVFGVGGGRRVDNRGVHDSACAHLNGLALQVRGHLLKQLLAQLVGLQPVAKAAHRGLIRHHPKVVP